MVLILSTSQSIKYLFSCRLSISSIILLNSWTSFILPTDLAVTCQLFCTAASIMAWRMENPVEGRDNATIWKQNKNKNCVEYLTKDSQKLASSKGTQTSYSLQVLHYLRKQQCRDQFLLSATPLPKSLTSAELLGGILPWGVSESVQYIILWSFQGCLWLSWGPCQLRRGACSHYLGKSPSAWRAGQKGQFACADCSNGSLTGKDPSTAQECQLSHCTGYWSHEPQENILVIFTLISKNVFKYGV